MIELFLAIIIGFFVGYVTGYRKVGNGWEESKLYYEKYKSEIRQHQEDIGYYKKLCKTLADENAEFRRNQK